MQSGGAGHGLGIGLLVVAVEAVQMDRRERDLVASEPPQSGLAAFGQAGQSTAALAQHPFQQRIVAAADDRRRRGRCNPARGDQARRKPAIERAPGKQPPARHLGAGHRSLRHELVELALGKPQIGRGLVGGQQIRHMHSPAQI